MEHTRRTPIKLRITELNSLIRVSWVHLKAQIERVGNPLIKPSDQDRVNMLITLHELTTLQAEKKMLAKELGSIPSRARHYAKQ